MDIFTRVTRSELLTLKGAIEDLGEMVERCQKVVKGYRIKVHALERRQKALEDAWRDVTSQRPLDNGADVDVEEEGDDPTEEREAMRLRIPQGR